MDLSSFNFL